MYLANCKINYGCMTYLHIEPLLTWDIRFLTYISGENDFSEPNWSDYLENAAFRHTQKKWSAFFKS